MTKADELLKAETIDLRYRIAASEARVRELERIIRLTQQNKPGDSKFDLAAARGRQDMSARISRIDYDIMCNRAEAAEACIQKLGKILERITETAILLSQETTDPGTEALAAIYCAQQTIRALPVE